MQALATRAGLHVSGQAGMLGSPTTLSDKGAERAVTDSVQLV